MVIGRPPARRPSAFRALVAAAAVVVVLAGALAHHHSLASDGADRCTACVLGGTVADAPEPPRVAAAPPRPDLPAPVLEAIALPARAEVLAVAPKTSPPVA